jgi:hypothetical protein
MGNMMMMMMTLHFHQKWHAAVPAGSYTSYTLQLHSLCCWTAALGVATIVAHVQPSTTADVA